MDLEQPRNGYEKVDSNLEGSVEFEDEPSQLLEESMAAEDDGEIPSADPEEQESIFHRTLMPDYGISICDHPLVEGSFTVKLLKFILLTFGSIALIHFIVSKLFSDRDQNLKLWHIWVFEGDQIVADCVIFFLVGRMWRQRGVDHLAWILPMIICNVYFESQNFFPWLQHSATLYEMHCLWPWQLWLFVLILIPTIGSLVVLHVVRAYQKRVFVMKIVELSFCAFLFVVPASPSPYFHLHHWFAGWLIGMHCNLDAWWSQAAMAYCWGMYCNGIAVYGRDPILTCEYAYFLSIDNQCPYVACYLEALKEMANHTQNANHTVTEMVPVDWRNCSASDDYQP